MSFNIDNSITEKLIESFSDNKKLKTIILQLKKIKDDFGEIADKNTKIEAPACSKLVIKNAAFLDNQSLEEALVDDKNFDRKISRLNFIYKCFELERENALECFDIEKVAILDRKKEEIELMTNETTREIENKNSQIAELEKVFIDKLEQVSSQFNDGVKGDKLRNQFGDKVVDYFVQNKMLEIVKGGLSKMQNVDKNQLLHCEELQEFLSQDCMLALLDM